MVLPLIFLAGAAMAGAGGATFKKGMGTKGTNPNQVYYGGNEDNANLFRQQYAGGIQDAQGQMAQGATGLQQLGQWGGGQAWNSQYTIDQGLKQAQVAGDMQRQQAMAGLGRSALDAYQPGQLAQAQLNLGLAQAQRNSLSQAAAAGNSALATQNAILAGAQNQADMSQQAAVLAAQDQQFKLGAQLQQANASNQALLGARQADMGLAGFGAQQQQFGIGTQMQAYGGLANLGQGREATYLDAQQQQEMAQLQAQQNYEMARMQNQQSKRAALINLGAGLIGAGGNLMTSGGGGGYGSIASAAKAKNSNQQSGGG